MTHLTQGAEGDRLARLRPDERRAFARIVAKGPRLRVGPTVARALLRERLVYVAVGNGRPCWHLTHPRGIEAARELERSNP